MTTSTTQFSDTLSASAHDITPPVRSMYAFRRPGYELESRSPIVPFGSTNYQLQLPDKLVIHEGVTWSVTQDKHIISQSSYLYVSYLKKHIENWNAFKNRIRAICDEEGLEAYWIDSECQSDLSKMGDIIRGASKTLVMIGPGDISPRSTQWLEWGSRLWTLPELIFSRDLTYKVGGSGLIDADGRKLCKLIYDWENRDLKTKLVYVYSELFSSSAAARKSNFLALQPINLVVPLIQAIWDNKDEKSQNTFELRMEKLYVFMTFLPIRLKMESISMKSEDDTFGALMSVNNWDTHKLSRHSKVPHPLSRPFEDVTIPSEIFLDRVELSRPSMIMLYDYRRQVWSIKRDSYSSYEYLAVSYRQADIANPNELKTSVEHYCMNVIMADAYWLDYFCMSGSPIESEIDIYLLGNVYSLAGNTLIILGDPDADDIVHDGFVYNESTTWKDWGDNIWSFVLILISSKLCYSLTLGSILPISRKDAFIRAYGMDERYIKLTDYFDHNQTMSDERQWPSLMSAIWGKTYQFGGKLRVEDHFGEAETLHLPKWEAERVYAFMALIPVRIFPNRKETEREALERLLKANGKDVSKFRRILRQWCDENLGANDTGLSLKLRSILDDDIRPAILVSKESDQSLSKVKVGSSKQQPPPRNTGRP